MRLVQAHLSQDDWQRLSVEHFEKPLTTRQLMRVAAWGLHELSPEGVERLRRGDPKGPVLILMWRLFLRPPFERREAGVLRFPGRRRRQGGALPPPLPGQGYTT